MRSRTDSFCGPFGCSRSGAHPTRKELRRLAEPRRPAALAVVSGLAGRNADFAEGAISSLVRRGLIEEVVDQRLAPTELGRLVVNALGLHPDEAPLFEVLDTDLRSSDPLAFARVVGPDRGARPSAGRRPVLPSARSSSTWSPTPR